MSKDKRSQQQPQKGNMNTTTSQDTSQEDQQQQQGQENQDQAADQQQQSQDNAGEGQQQNESTGDKTAADAAGVETKVEPEAAAAVVKDPVQEKVAEQATDPASATQKEGFTPVYKVQLDLTNYHEHMDPKKSLTPEEGGKWQYGLFGTLKGVLNAKSQEDFNKEWNTALIYFNQNKETMFNENFMFRFPEHWAGSQTEFTTFRRLIYLMIQTSNAKTRKAELKHINLGLVVEGLNATQRANLLNFYEA